MVSSTILIQQPTNFFHQPELHHQVRPSPPQNQIIQEWIFLLFDFMGVWFFNNWTSYGEVCSMDVLHHCRNNLFWYVIVTRETDLWEFLQVLMVLLLLPLWRPMILLRLLLHFLFLHPLLNPKILPLLRYFLLAPSVSCSWSSSLV